MGPITPMGSMGDGAKRGRRHSNKAYGAFAERGNVGAVSMATGPRACYGGSEPMGPVRPMGPMGAAVKWRVSPWQRGLWGLKRSGGVTMAMRPMGPIGPMGAEAKWGRLHGNEAYGAYRAYRAYWS